MAVHQNPGAIQQKSTFFYFLVPIYFIVPHGCGLGLWLWACCRTGVLFVGCRWRLWPQVWGPAFYTGRKTGSTVRGAFVFVVWRSCGGRSIRCVFVPLSFGVVVHRMVIGVLSTYIVSLSCESCWVRCVVVQHL